MKIILDAYAWIEYLDGTDEGMIVKKLLEDNDCFTLLINLSEVVSKASRTGRDVEIAYKAIISNSELLTLDAKLAKEGGLLHAEIHKKMRDMSLADSLLLQVAREMDAKVVTGDKHFKGFKEAILIR
jgi:predicted nucleic acid-binding protein